MRHKKSTLGYKTWKYNTKYITPKYTIQKYTKHMYKITWIIFTKNSNDGKRTKSTICWDSYYTLSELWYCKWSSWEQKQILVSLQPTYPLHSGVYPISEANSSTPSNLLMLLKQDSWWGMNVMNDGKWILLCNSNKNEIQWKI